tara:strand:- start:421 stop:657 length:237 start_codon:yes stop_codon:yes gene_type:complete
MTQRPLSRGDVEAVQQQLNQLGFEAGVEDGIFGSGTRAALSDFQRSRGLVADGYPDADSIEGLQDAAARDAAEAPGDD